MVGTNYVLIRRNAVLIPAHCREFERQRREHLRALVAVKSRFRQARDVLRYTPQYGRPFVSKVRPHRADTFPR